MTENPSSRTPADSPAVRFPPPFAYALGFGLGLGLERRWPRSLFPAGFGESWREGLGLAMAVAALALLGISIATFWRARTTILPNRAVTFLALGGPYRWSRNPMYLGMVLLYLGLTVLVDSPWPLAPLPAVVALIDRYVIRREERHLEARFGADYDAYRRRVRRWI
jgi:protein-S-isoprenylcysteine O-methyltransferase Ste14